ncbi:MIP/aquaporin family protein [Paraclostridium bifermentans]|uniref:MIP/aquaporin family protein n=1 Tax=Paraclostridium bifermentans TaxID=1490 RepID=UPI0018A0CFCC|nr:MIP/aquaporin family protein [Paraclostridium bifermentans]
MNVFLAEFIGVTILIFIGCGVLAGNSLKESRTYKVGSVEINLAWGFAVTLAIYAVGDISGAHLNPAFTIAKALNGSFEWKLVPGYIVAQLLGAMFGSLLVYFQFLPHWEKVNNPEVKLNIFVTSPAIKNNFTNFISEYLITFILIFSLLVLDRNSFVDGLKPIVVGGLIFTLGVSFGGVTGAALNPARDFGPRLAYLLLPIPGKGSSNFKYGWIPVLAPTLGGSTGAMINLALYDNIIDFRVLGIISMTLITFIIVKFTEKSESRLKKNINYQKV